MLEVVRYEASLRESWNALLTGAKNGLFLFDRDYMEYHAERFEDISAVVLLKGEPAILFPASFDHGHVNSHAGLTFGGLVVRRDLRSHTVLTAVDALFAALRSWGGEQLSVRLVPPVFVSYPAGEVDFAFWRRGLRLARRDISSVLPLDAPLGPTKAKQRDASRARKLGLTVKHAPLAEFYPILEDVLQDRHGRGPVHSLSELERLQERFPDRILVRGAYRKTELLAGTVLYRYDRVWHTQYLASAPAGRGSSALDLVIVSAIEEAAGAGAQCFSFGTSMEGDVVNEGLLWHKESFGARSILHDVLTGPL